MVQEEIQAYLKQCQDLGYTFDQIKISLLNAGWSQMDIEDSFKQPLPNSFGPDPVSTPVENKVSDNPFPTRKRSAWPVISLLVIFLLVVLTAVPIAFAEQGYLPFLSKLYRKTPLPLLWKGTDDNLAVLTTKLAQNISQIKQTSDTETTQITLQQADPTKTDTSLPSSIYPLTLSYNFIAEGTPSQAYLKLNLDLTDVLQKIPSLASFVSTLKNQDSLELVVPNKNNLYLRSSLIPYLSSLDNNKWLGFPITAQAASFYGNNSPLKSVFTQSNLTKIQAILQKDLQDQGIVRKNNQALVLYDLNLDNNDYQSLVNILSNSQGTSSSSTVTSVASGVNFTMKMQLWLDPSTALPKYIQTQINSSAASQNLTALVSSTDSFSYGNITPIVQPSADQIIPDGATYLTKVYQKLFNNK